jgi:hypothetical protein
MKLYSVAEVLSAIPPNYKLMKKDLSSGFSQIRIAEQYTKYYGIYYQGQKYALHRLSMGHSLAPSILQRLSQHVAAILHQRFGVSMVAYLDDWLIFGQSLPSRAIITALQHLGLTINFEKSVVRPASSLIYLGLHIDLPKLIYLGLHIDLPKQLFQPTVDCITHLLQLLSIVPKASSQDLRRITGYATWLAWALNWPMFAATHILQCNTYWLRRMHTNRLLQQPRKLVPARNSIMVYTDATPNTTGILWPGPPPTYLNRQYEDYRQK